MHVVNAYKGSAVFLVGFQDVDSPDWENGLPTDVLALVAKAGGVGQMKCMREVCKSWQAGFGLSVTCLKASYGGFDFFVPTSDPLRAEGLRAHILKDRFPALTSLKLTVEGSSLSKASLMRFRGLPITSLNLDHTAFCSDLRADGLAALEGMPLRQLNLIKPRYLTDSGFASLGRFPLTSLSLEGCPNLTDAGLAALRGLPLERLSLRRCRGWTDPGLANLRGLPLRFLDLAYCSQLTDKGLDQLHALPLFRLCLTRSPKITQAGTQALQRSVDAIHTKVRI